jgi:hypothetical protein
MWRMTQLLVSRARGGPDAAGCKPVSVAEPHAGGAACRVPGVLRAHRADEYTVWEP